MLLPAPHTWVAGDAATSGNLQSLSYAVAFALNPPKMIRRQTNPQVVNNTGPIALLFDALDSDNDNISNGSITNFKIQTTGLYHVRVALTWGTSAPGAAWALALYANGTQVEQVHMAPTAQSGELNFDDIITNGTTLQAFAIQATAGSLVLAIESKTPRMEVIFRTLQ